MLLAVVICKDRDVCVGQWVRVEQQQPGVAPVAGAGSSNRSVSARAAVGSEHVCWHACMLKQNLGGRCCKCLCPTTLRCVPMCRLPCTSHPPVSCCPAAPVCHWNPDCCRITRQTMTRTTQPSVACAMRCQTKSTHSSQLPASEQFLVMSSGWWRWQLGAAAVQLACSWRQHKQAAALVCCAATSGW